VIPLRDIVIPIEKAHDVTLWVQTERRHEAIRIKQGLEHGPDFLLRKFNEDTGLEATLYENIGQLIFALSFRTIEPIVLTFENDVLL
jgi:hypothetical protein